MCGLADVLVMRHQAFGGIKTLSTLCDMSKMIKNALLCCGSVAALVSEEVTLGYTGEVIAA